jgi:hypothetical protein
VDEKLGPVYLKNLLVKKKKKKKKKIRLSLTIYMCAKSHAS